MSVPGAMARPGPYDPTMSVVASIFVGLAAVLHGYIFWMESIAWTRPQVWKRFGVADRIEVVVKPDRTSTLRITA